MPMREDMMLTLCYTLILTPNSILPPTLILILLSWSL